MPAAYPRILEPAPRIQPEGSVAGGWTKRPAEQGDRKADAVSVQGVETVDLGTATGFRFPLPALQCWHGRYI